MKLTTYQAFIGLSFSAVLSVGIYLITTSQSDNPFLEDSDSLKITEESEGESKLATIEGRMEQEFELTKDLAINRVPRERLVSAYEYMLKNQNDEDRAALSITWTERGPTNVGGRTRAIMFDANDGTNSTVFAGSVSGGLWKTTDITAASPNWTQVDDFFDNLNITWIIQDPSNANNIYFGTGEGWYNVDAAQGLGIWKSTDGGANFSQLSSTNNSTFYHVQRLIIDTNGNLYAATRAGGVQRSTDGGTSWAQVLGSSVGAGANNAAADLCVSADGSIYASLGNIFSTGQVWKSDFTTHGANTGAAGNWTDVSPTGSYLRVELACAPSDANVVYAMCQISGNSVGFFYRSGDAGGSWVAKTVASWGSQAWYDLLLAVDPNDEDRLHAAGVGGYYSTDGGGTWNASFSGVHADHHNFVFASGSSSIAITSNDGGVYYTSDANSNPPTFSNKETNYQTTQFYACAIHPTFGSDFILGGTQDNGTITLQTAGLGAGTSVIGGDGGFCHIDQNESTYMFGSYIRNNHYRSTNGGASFSSVISNSNGSFINPSDYDNTNNILYAGNTSGSYFRWNDPQTGNSNDDVTVSNFSGGTITHVAVSPNVSNRVYFGLNNGDVVKVDNANTGTSLTGTIIRSGSGSVSCLEIESGNEDHMIVTYSNYGQVSVYETMDGTAGTPTWTDIEGNLPDMPVRWAVFNPNNNDQLLLATELGVWSTDNIDGGSTSWGASNTGLANMRVSMLQTRTSDDIVLASTHGRGMFTTDHFSSLLVNFSSSTSSQEEDGSTGTTASCKDYVAVNVPITISKNPSTNVIVDIAVNGSSTATVNRDYILNTSQVTFTNGGSQTQNAVVWVIDDAIIDGSKTVILDITVNNPGSGASLGATTQHTLTVTDNDVEPISGVNNVTQTLGTGSVSQQFAPFRGAYEDARTEIIYLASELTALGYSAGNITAIAFDVSSKNSSLPYSNFQVLMQNSSDTQVDGAFETGLTTVYTGSVTTALGWNTITLSTPFAWDGTSSLIVQLCFDNSSSSSSDYVNATTSAFVSMEYSRDNGVAGCSIASVQFNSSDRPNTRFTIEQVVEVASTLNDTRHAYLVNGETAYFTNSSDQIIASVQQTSGSDIGCVTLTIDGAGTGTSMPGWMGGSYSITDKTFLITADNDADYEVTFFFSDAELNTWGANKTTLNMLKSTGAISSASIANSTIVENANLTVATYGSANNIYYRETFNSFSGFALTDAPESILPIELINFRGEQVDEQINLYWETQTEINNDFFTLERSIDGTAFEPIATVKGAGTTTENQNYQHIDKAPFVGLNYYRLTQTDYDGRTSESSVIAIWYNKKGDLSVFPNPVGAGQALSVLFTTEQAGLATIEIVDLSGKQVAQSQQFMTRGIQQHALSIDQLQKGVYVLKIEQNGIVEQKKFVKM